MKDDYHASKRWRPFVNRSGETIPAYAILALRPVTKEPISYTNTTWDGSREILEAYKPDDVVVAHGNPWLCAVNSGVAVPKGGWGECTQDWPALVLHDGSQDNAPNGQTVGPKDGSWFVWSNAGAGYTAVAHSRKPAVDDKGRHLMWIAPKSREYTPRDAFYWPGATIDKGESFFTHNYQYRWQINTPYIHWTTDTSKNADAIFVTFAGVYIGHFQFTGTPGPSVAGHNMTIGAAVYKVDTSGNESPTAYRGSEVAAQYPTMYGAAAWTSSHHITIPFMLYLASGEGIAIRSIATDTMTFSETSMILHKHGPIEPSPANEPS